LKGKYKIEGQEDYNLWWISKANQLICPHRMGSRLISQKKPLIIFIFINLFFKERIEKNIKYLLVLGSDRQISYFAAQDGL
jgi:hypothetical protein